jgi:hypothetical protein
LQAAGQASDHQIIGSQNVTITEVKEWMSAGAIGQCGLRLTAGGGQIPQPWNDAGVIFTNARLGWLRHH